MSHAAPQILPDYTLPPGWRYGLKVVNADGRPESDKAPAAFRWSLTPGETTTAPDWDPTPRCGGGLHLWRDGQGDLSTSSIHAAPDSVWLVVAYDESSAVDLDGKIKVPTALTVAVGERTAVASWLAQRVPGAVHYAHVSAGDYGTATAGDYGTATAGDYGELRLRWWDDAARRYRTAIAYVGEDGIKPGVKYRLDDDHKFVEVS